ncbi:DUF4375 domain-containing protein [Mucilaginibacter terrenus]|uniref:DUF4375 domain-containing protein n=1 Tax=Mucilaginibacter terrenus TaxID=2482727 RepID=A0A3E2NKX2_9SPHI|nr:DUF4375 domain-containing protein [Mucilaginibacter terrenus]RFZ81639.1 DUF4375 domain-containing protein [Mucilaginibacter terrenus]
MSDASFIEEQYEDIISGIKPEWVFKQEQLSEYLLALPTWRQAIYFIVNLDNQVFNGGFHQYFTNRYGAFAQEAINALIMIGATDTAKIVKRAYQLVNAANDAPVVFQEKILKKRYKNLITDEDLFEPLNQLDKAYANNGEDVMEMLLNFITGNS